MSAANQFTLKELYNLHHFDRIALAIQAGVAVEVVDAMIAGHRLTTRFPLSFIAVAHGA